MKSTNNFGTVIPFPNIKKEEEMSIFESANKLRKESIERYFDLYCDGVISYEDFIFMISEE